MKKTIYLLTMITALLHLAACMDEAIVKPLPGGAGQIRIAFTTSVPPQTEVDTRAGLDPTGVGINTLWLFNFSEDRIFLGRTKAELTDGTGKTEGHFSATIPSATRIVHLLANQNLDDFNDKDMNGSHENYVMNGLTSTSGGFVYWGRVDGSTVTSPEDFAALFTGKGNTIWLYRNLAKITCRIGEQNYDFPPFTVCNRYAYGSSVPFNGTYPVVESTCSIEFLTLPEDRSKLADADDVEPVTAAENFGQYIFESPNTDDDAMYVIVRIDNENDNEYYKVMLIDENFDPIPIIRNHSYNIRFKTEPKRGSGYPTFQAAKDGVPYNNVLVSVDDDVPSVEGGEKVELNVVETTRIYTEQTGKHDIPYQYNGSQEVEVKWLTNDGVAADDIVHNQTTDVITITINPLSTTGMRYGKLQVKAGRLVRYINIYAGQPFQFAPVWTSNAISNVQAGEDVGLVFYIPDNYPQELLPVRCLITADQLSGRGTPPLSIITRASYVHNEDSKEYVEDAYGKEDPPCGYKYVYEADRTGQHRIYFFTNHSGEPTGEIWLEAQHFTTVKRKYTYVNAADNQLLVVGDEADDIRDYKGEGGSDKAIVYYKLVPRLKGSSVSFSLKHGTDKANKADLPAGTKIMVYTRLLEPDREKIPDTDVLSQQQMTTEGFSYYLYTVPASGGDGKLYFKTTGPICEETIRFSSVAEDGSGVGKYKSTTLEVSNFGPWQSTLAWTGSTDAQQQIAYGTDREVPLTFSLKTFESTDENAGKTVFVNPPVDTYKVYIYTENLNLKGAATEAKKDARGKRYYEYEVTTTASGGGEDETTLSFTTNRVVSGETVVIRPDSATLVFEPAVFRLTNTPIEGRVTYGTSPGTPVPQGSFVTLVREDGTRIGNVTVGTDGHYTMTLRSEYSFNEASKVYMYYAPGEVGAGSSAIYTSALMTLAELMETPDVSLANTQ